MKEADDFRLCDNTASVWPLTLCSSHRLRSYMTSESTKQMNGYKQPLSQSSGIIFNTNRHIMMIESSVLPLHPISSTPHWIFVNIPTVSYKNKTILMLTDDQHKIAISKRNLRVSPKNLLTNSNLRKF